MIGDALQALADIWTPAYRSVFWRVLALTLLLIVGAVVGLDRLAFAVLPTMPTWLAATVAVAAGLGLLVGGLYVLPAVSALVAGFFLDDLALVTEQMIGAPPGRALALGDALWLGVKFAVVALVVNAVALLLLLLPGVNVIAFLVANAYLFGRAFFEFAALRYVSLDTVRALRRQQAARLFAAGFVIAVLAAIPIVNLLTPLFGVAFMVRTFARMRAV